MTFAARVCGRPVPVREPTTRDALRASFEAALRRDAIVPAVIAGWLLDDAGDCAALAVSRARELGREIGGENLRAATRQLEALIEEEEPKGDTRP